MCLSFLLAFACKVVRVLLLEGKCIASLQEDPAEDNLCLACFYCATTVQGLELDLRFCDGKLDCFFCCTASPYLPLDTFLSRERARSFKKGPTATSAQTFTFFQVLDPFLRPERPTSSKKGATATSAQTFAFFSRRWTPFWAVSGRDAPKRGPPPHQLRSFNFDVAGPLFEAWEAGILHKGELQPDVKLGGFKFVSSFAQGKCIASLQEDPAADSLCLGCFCCATTMQRLELDLRFCDRKLDCFFCWSASPYLPLDPFLRRVRPRSSKKGATATSAQTLTFFQALDPFLSRLRPRSSNKGATFTSAPIFQFSRRWTPFWAVRGRDPPQRGASTWRQTRWLQICFFFCAGKVHCFSARGSRCRQFMLGLLLLRYYNAKAWTWPPLLWSETGLLLLLIGFSLSTAGPLFAPCAAEILQKGGYRHISSDLDLFPGAGPLFAPWAAEILQKGGHRHISSDLYLFPGAGPLFEPAAAEIL